MRRLSAVLLVGGMGIVIAISSPVLLQAKNSLRVESKTVAPNATGIMVGLFLTNDVDYLALTVPVEFRTVSNGAFITGSAPTDLQNNIPTANRVGSSPLMTSVTKNRYPTPGGTACSGPTSHTYATSGAIDYVSPDGFLFALVSTASDEPIALTPGSDPSGSDNASFNFVFNVNDKSGDFEIDTCCMRPANHLEGTDRDVNSVPIEFTKGVVTIGGDDVRSIESGSTLPNTYDLEPNYPNPFNAGTVIRFALPHDGRVSLTIYNILGRKVRTLLNDDKPLGVYAADWDGRDDAGNPVGTGVYFYRLQTTDFTKTRSMLLLK